MFLNSDIISSPALFRTQMEMFSCLAKCPSFSLHTCTWTEDQSIKGIIWFDLIYNLYYLKGISFFIWIDVPEVMNNAHQQVITAKQYKQFLI